jgi:tetratricopeptide (TPR) repeat protein
MATMVDPAAMEWRVGLGESLFRQSRFADAAALFGALIAEHPERPDLWRFQGEAYALSNQPLKAAECFEMACSLGGATTEMLNNLGLIYARQEIHDMAVNSYLAAIDKDPATSLEPALNVAKFLSANGAHGELRRLIEGIESRRGGALDLDDRKDLLRLRARIAVAEGAGDEEVAVLAKIVELDPLDGDALILLGRHRGRHGEFEQAALFFERAAGLEAHEAEAKLRHGELLAKQGKYAQALPHLRRAHALMDQRDDVQKFLEQVERIAQAR